MEKTRLPFTDRKHAGACLAQELAAYSLPAPVVVGVGRGGVPVAAEVAQALHAPLDVLSVRKLRAPWQPARAIGAVTCDGARALDQPLIEDLGIARPEIDAAALDEQEEAQRRQTRYRTAAPAIELRGRTVILVDEGFLTGTTMRAAVRSARKHTPARVIAAAPVGSKAACAAIRRDADMVVCLETPEPFSAIGSAYKELPQTDDADVVRLLAAARQEALAPLAAR